MALVYGFGGMRDRNGELSFRPRLPQRMSRLAFKVHLRGSTLEVDIAEGGATYRFESDDELTILHCGESLRLRAGAPVTRPLVGRAGDPVRDRQAP